MSKLLRVDDKTHAMILEKAAATGLTAGQFINRLLLAAWVLDEMQDRLGQAAADCITSQIKPKGEGADDE